MTEIELLSREAKKAGLAHAQNIVLRLAVMRDQSGGISDETRAFALKAKELIEDAIKEIDA